MIKAIEVRNDFGDYLYMELRNPEKSGFLVFSVSGLTQPEAEISTNEYSMIDGVYVSNTRLRARNIVFNIIYYDHNKVNKSIEELRYWCHRYFPVKQKVKLLFYMDDSPLSKFNNLDCTLFGIEGYVESNETNIFSETEGSQISVICNDPYFTKFAPIYTAEDWGEQLLITHEFSEEDDDEFENRQNLETDAVYVKPNSDFSMVSDISSVDLSDDETIENFPGLNIAGARSLSSFIRNEEVMIHYLWESSMNIYYDGSGETGVIVQIEAYGNAGEIRVNNTTRSEKLIIDTSKFQTLIGSDLSDGDLIEIGTARGNKYASLKRGNKSYNILDAVDVSSKWICLQHGNNNLTWTAASGAGNILIGIMCYTRVLGI